MKNNSRSIPLSTIKALLARSGNQCAFRDCEHPIVDDNNLFIAQLCHIEAVSPKGQRFNPLKTQEQINSYENLLFLCYRHHKVTDNETLYTVEELKKMKDFHESRFKENPFTFSDDILLDIKSDIDSYWSNIEMLNENHIVPDFKVEINTAQDIIALLEEINELVTRLQQVNGFLMKDLSHSHFEDVCLAMPNSLTRIYVILLQIKVKYLEEHLIQNPQSKSIQHQLGAARKALSFAAQNTGLAD